MRRVANCYTPFTYFTYDFGYTSAHRSSIWHTDKVYTAQARLASQCYSESISSYRGVGAVDTTIAAGPARPASITYTVSSAAAAAAAACDKQFSLVECHQVVDRMVAITRWCLVRPSIAADRQPQDHTRLSVPPRRRTTR